MSATATTPPGVRPDRLRAMAGRRPALSTVAGLALLAGISLALRTQALDAKLWIDEGLSIGIASHGLLDIPGLLRQDGSPPLYYLLLHVWIELFGDGEARTHALSLGFALATIPLGFLGARAVFGPQAGWACAALAALNPYLTYYAQETRMYALAALLSLAVCVSFALAFAHRRRAFLPVFVAAGALLAYTHNWGLFLLAGVALAVLVLAWQASGTARRGLARDGVVAFGALGLLYLPWVPSVLFQAEHTGAPWAERPDLDAVVNGFSGVLGGEAPAVLGAFVALGGLAVVVGRGVRADPRARAVVAVGVALGAGVLLAFLASLASPAWATRYMAVFVGPLLLLLAAGLTQRGRLGILALVVVLLFWTDGRERELRGKSNAYRVATTLHERGYVSPGDLVLTTHPEYGPVMRYYLGGDGLRWADALGPVPDPQIFDWRDALDRLRESGPIRVSREVLPALREGQHLLLIQPIIRSGRWGAPWTRLIRKRAAAWQRTLDHTQGLVRVEPLPVFGERRPPRGVRAVVYRRTALPLRLPPPPPPASPVWHDKR